MSRQRREERAAQREALSESTKAKPVIAIIAGVAALAIVGGAVTAVVLSGQDDASQAQAPGTEATPGSSTDADPVQQVQVDANAPLPLGVFPAGHPLEYGFPLRDPNTIDDGKPVVEVWEDFQCPSCKLFEQGPGQMLKLLSGSGEAHVVVRPSAFLDSRGGTSSAQAIAALGCAIDLGKGIEFQGRVFESTPDPNDGARASSTGWDTQQFIQFAAEIGMTGETLDQFGSCVEAGTYLGWAQNSTAVFADKGIQGTPTVFVNGRALEGSSFSDPETFTDAIFAVPANPELSLD